jgi:hypothetical protein
VAFRQTRYSDVCGTTDAFKALLKNEYDRAAADPQGVLGPLLEDALYMIGRMRTRREAYLAYVEQVRGVLDLLASVEDPGDRDAEDGARFIRACIASSEEFRGVAVEKIEGASERIRRVAGNHEQMLRQYKDLALTLHEQFMAIKGSRPWLVEEEDKGSLLEALRRQYQAWLPPEPHCDHLLDWLSRARAAVLEERLPDGQPAVQFEDGGSIPMSQVRYDTEVKNFHPAEFKPVPTARETE